LHKKIQRPCPRASVIPALLVDVLAGGRATKSATTRIRYQPPSGPDPNFFSSVGLVSYIPHFAVKIVDCLS
jgi:hypothetical protein